jgi:hypothetical protein
MSIRDQERRQKRAQRRIDERMRLADKHVRGSAVARQREADRRANDVIKRIEKGGVDPRPLPGLREDSIPSTESSPSMEASPSMQSMESAQTVCGVTGESEASRMQEDMPLQEAMPYDPADAVEDLAKRTTEETGSEGDVHLHAERKAGEMAQQMTEGTGAGGDMNLHAERKVEQMGDGMFDD